MRPSLYKGGFQAQLAGPVSALKYEIAGNSVRKPNKFKIIDKK
jgi:hypothetical protein